MQQNPLYVRRVVLEGYKSIRRAETTFEPGLNIIITYLNLSSNYKISNLTLLHTLTPLTSLRLTNTGISDISPPPD